MCHSQRLYCHHSQQCSTMLHSGSFKLSIQYSKNLLAHFLHTNPNLTVPSISPRSSICKSSNKWNPSFYSLLFVVIAVIVVSFSTHSPSSSLRYAHEILCLHQLKLEELLFHRFMLESVDSSNENQIIINQKIFKVKIYLNAIQRNGYLT